MLEAIAPVLTKIQEKTDLVTRAVDNNLGLTAIQAIYQIGIAAAIFVGFWLVRGLLTRLITTVLQKAASRTKTPFDDHLVSAFAKPLRFFFAGLGLYAAVLYLPLKPDYNPLFAKLFRSFMIVVAGAGIYNFAGSYTVLRSDLEKLLGSRIDKILIPFVSKIFKVVIVALAFTVIAEEWGFKVNSFIAGLGLGGLAFALAAKDTIANIFGGFVIITDKPFSIGDWIRTPSVEGTVEDINFRSTKIRVFSQAIVTVPNSTLANEPITNWSRMGKRRITFRLGITYATTRVPLESCIGDIRAMLSIHPEIHQETIVVRFDSFGTSSLEILLYFFTKTTAWEEYLAVKEDVNFKIMDILEKHQLVMAFPSTSVYFETPLVHRQNEG